MRRHIVTALFALEYVNPVGKSLRKGRVFKKPDDQDLANVRMAEDLWSKTESRFVPPMTKFLRAMKLIDFTDGAIENTLSFSTLGNCLASKLVLVRLMKSQIHEFAAL